MWKEYLKNLSLETEQLRAYFYAIELNEEF